MTEAAAPARLAYRVGNEHDPGNPFGRSELTIDPDGVVRLENVARFDRRRAWTGRLEPAALERLWSALHRAGFPQVPAHRIPAGSTMRALTVSSERGTESASIEYHAARRLAGYDEAFAILDAVIWRMSDGSAERAPAAPGEVVTDVRPME